MHIDTVRSPNGKTHHYLRQSYRVGKTVRKRTLAKLSDLPQPALLALQRALQNKNSISLDSTDDCRILRSLPHGHVLAALHALRRSGLSADLHPAPSRARDLATALIVARLLFPKSKRITRFLIQHSSRHNLATSSLGLLLGLGDVGHNEPYQTLDWLHQHQADIETRLARRHLNAGSLVLYDVTSTYFEGRRGELATHGYSRDHRPDRPQIVIGLLASEDGCPVGVEVFPGNTSDPKTLTAQVQQVQRRFGTQRLIWVGDRGMITSARIREDFRSRPELDWVSALRGIELLEDLVRMTGGRTVTIRSDDDLQGAFEEILRDLRVRYVLAFSPDPGRQGFVPIEVRVKRPRVRVRAREGYTARP